MRLLVLRRLWAGVLPIGVSAILLCSCSSPSKSVLESRVRVKHSSLPDMLAWVTNTSANQVDPVDLNTATVGSPIPTGIAPQGIVVGPRGKFAFVADSGWGGNFEPSYEVTPILLRTRRSLAPIKAGFGPLELAVDSPLDRVYAVDMGAMAKGNFFDMIDGTTVTPIDAVSLHPLPAVNVGRGPGGMAIAPNGKIGVVVDAGTTSRPSIHAVILDLRDGSVLRRVQVGIAPQAVSITPNGKYAFVSDTGWPRGPGVTLGGKGWHLTSHVVVLSLPKGKVLHRIKVGPSPFFSAASPGGRFVYVGNDAWGEAKEPIGVSVIDVAAMKVVGFHRMHYFPGPMVVSGPWLVMVASGSHHGHVLVFNRYTWKLQEDVVMNGSLGGIALSRLGN